MQLLKWHAPYHESDHVLAMAINVLCNGERLEHLERLRNDSAFLDAMRADSIHDHIQSAENSEAKATGFVRGVLHEH